MNKPKSQSGSWGWFISLFGKGKSPLLSRNVNELVGPLNALGRMTIVRNPAATGDSIIYGSDNIVFELAPNEGQDAPTSVTFKRAEITAIGGDYLTANQWNEDTSDFTGGSVTIAKPPHLRNSLASETIWGVSHTYSSYQSNTIERTATYNSASVKQRVFPPYLVGDEIFFAETSELVGVSTYTKIDANIAARKWFTETEGCDPDTGDPTYAFVSRGPWSDTAVGAAWP